ncbi:radical SAM protein [Candidatus Micrarchaeota archaeon]|nr:radical SAM protein [Candidatus Micrarchaeota archaeon]
MYRTMIFLKNILLSNFNMLDFPYILNFAVTYRCNLKCKMCNIWKQKCNNELELSEIDKIFQNQSNFSWIRLTGGEIFLRDDIVEIVDIISSYNKDLFLLTTPTNGYCKNLIIKKVKEIMDLNIPKYIITVSLDGTEEIHDFIRGTKGSWRNCVNTYKELKRFSENESRLEVYFGYTISPYNVGYFEKTLLSLKKEIPEITIKDFHFNLFHTSKNYYFNYNKKYKFYYPSLRREIKRLSYLYNTTTNPISIIEKKYLSLIPQYLQNEKLPLQCKAIQSSIFLDPKGNLYPCTIFNNKIGNVRDFGYDLRKTLRSDKSVKYAIDRKLCSGCWTPCEAHQAILGNLFKIRT